MQIQDQENEDREIEEQGQMILEQNHIQNQNDCRPFYTFKN